MPHISFFPRCVFVNVGKAQTTLAYAPNKAERRELGNRNRGSAARKRRADMSRPSFRPRPIDLTKPLPIIKSSKDLRNEDDVVVNRALPAVATGVDPAEEEERHLQQALLASVFGDTKTAPADIPVPVVAPVEPPTISGAPFRRPDQYIMFDRSDHDLEDACIEYDADHKDENFVKRINTARANGPHLNLDTLERAMDAMEKAQGRSEDQEVLVAYAAVRSLLSELASSIPEAVRRELHTHWLKRRTEEKTPFLRIYQKPPDPGNNDPSVAFRPRDRDSNGGAGRRMNTYDNFRRATILRTELKTLLDILDKVVEREETKELLLGVKLLEQRAAATSDGGQRIESVNRSIFSGEQEPVACYGPPQMQVLVPCRGLRLPAEIKVVQKRLSVGPGDKMSKKNRRRLASKNAADKLRGSRELSAGGDARVSGPGFSTGVDTFGFDEHGNKFLKHMRYFAGGFMNYGVSPYDHRVFAAASERNTVRVLPREPRPVNFPGPQVRFGSLRDTNKIHRGAKIGSRSEIITSSDVCADIVGEKRMAAEAFKGSGIHRRRAGSTYRTRARVGRGGRIILDRVMFERERGVKAASYPASVEMGGVYTAGIPLDAAKEVGKVVEKGEMGRILELGGEFEEEGWGGETGDMELARKMIPALQPMMQLSSGIGVEPNVVNFWPRRKKRAKGGLGKKDEVRRGEEAFDLRKIGRAHV